MEYEYEAEKQWLFTDEGQRAFLQLRDYAHDLLTTAGAFREMEVIAHLHVSSSYQALACVDRLMELGEVVCVRDHGWRQYRVYSTPQTSNR